MNNETILVLTKEGMELRRTTVTPQALNEPAVIEILTKNKPLVLKNVANIGGPFGRASVIMRSGIEMWSVRVTTLVLETNFVVEDGILYPDFMGDHQSQPMRMEWKPTMPITFGIIALWDRETRYAGDRYLMAFDTNNQMWRLPLPNLYDDGKLCHGQPPTYHNTALECVLKTCAQLVGSKWNNHLYAESPQEKAWKLFRWKANDTGFEQLPAEVKLWTTQCTKIASENLSQLITP